MTWSTRPKMWRWRCDRPTRPPRWEALTAGKRRGLLYQIGTAKTAATRAKRIHALIQSLT